MEGRPKRKSRAQLQPGDPGYRAPRTTFADQLAFHGVTTEEAAEWGPRLIHDGRRTVISMRLAGSSYRAAGEAIGGSREKAQQQESYALRTIKAAKEGRNLSQFKEKPMNTEATNTASTAAALVPTVYITVDGGVAYVGYADVPVNVIIVDYDTDDEGVKQDPDGIKAHIHEECAEVDPYRVAAFRAIAAQPSGEDA